MIPVEHELQLVQNGIHFMRSITEAYGTEQGMRLWNTIADTIDPELKGKIFFSLLTGQYNNRITIIDINTWSQKIPLIKCVRTWDTRKLGLKEAKDLLENFYANKTKIVLEVNPSDRYRVIEELRTLGCTV